MGTSEEKSGDKDVIKIENIEKGCNVENVERVCNVERFVSSEDLTVDKEQYQSSINKKSIQEQVTKSA